VDRSARAHRTQTGKPSKAKGSAQGWKAIPKFVKSQSELEMDEATEDGTTKRRSAFTPVEDIEAGSYELRRVKSWEANPVSVCVLNID